MVEEALAVSHFGGAVLEGGEGVPACVEGGDEGVPGCCELWFFFRELASLALREEMGLDWIGLGWILEGTGMTNRMPRRDQLPALPASDRVHGVGDGGHPAIRVAVREDDFCVRVGADEVLG